MGSGLTPKQKSVFEFIQTFSKKRGYAPSQNEIAEYFGFKSLGTVQNYIVRLERHGFLQRSWNAKRSIQLLKQPQPDFSVTVPPPISSIHLPLLGEVAAGYPIEAVEGDEKIEVPTSMLKNGDHFVLRVKGQSMIDEGILEGDFVIVKRQTHAENGQIVVATINNEATIKKLFKRNQGQLIELYPANPSFDVIKVDFRQDPSVDFEIKGILSGVIRRYL